MLQEADLIPLNGSQIPVVVFEITVKEWGGDRKCILLDQGFNLVSLVDVSDVVEVVALEEADGELFFWEGDLTRRVETLYMMLRETGKMIDLVQLGKRRPRHDRK